MRIKKMPATLAMGAVATVTFTVAVPSTAFASETTTTQEVAGALDAVDARNGDLVAEPVSSTADSDSAAQTAVVDVPTDPTKGVRLKGKDGQTVTLHLPSARKGDTGKRTQRGAVVFGSRANSVNAAIPAEGGIQLWTHIRNKKADENYRYCTDSVRFTVLQNGGAIGLDSAEKPVAMVPPPTATEKKTGKAIPTHYTADGNCLVQYVAHKARGTSYPVLADPYFSWYWDGVVVTLSRADMATVMYGGTQALIPMLLVPGIGWGTIAGVLWVSGHATWAYANRKCAWFWLPYIGWGASMGWYNC